MAAAGGSVGRSRIAAEERLLEVVRGAQRCLQGVCGAALSYVFLAGILIFAISSAYFYFAGKNRAGLNSDFLVNSVTWISYVLMWQGN